MAVDMFLKIGNINGESQDEPAKGTKHKGEIDILAWSWGLSQSGTTHTGGGSGAGKVNVQDISITKYVDSATPNLIRSCAKGTHIKEALLTVRKAGDDALEYIKITLSDVIITSISTGGSGGEDRLTENVTLNFAQFKFDYTPQKGSGAGDASKCICYNIAKNTEV